MSRNNSLAKSYEDTLASIDFALEGASLFSYRCNACSRCCHDKAIRVGPYEILRLARRLGLTTTEFIAQHTEAGGTLLRMQDANDRACIFLTDEGCGVYPDRPVVCRIYPLARSVDADGHERFGQVSPHPDTDGIYGASGTVAGFVEKQGAVPFFEISRRYAALYLRMVEALERLDPEELQRGPSHSSAVEETAPGVAASPWTDIDLTVAEFCRAKERPIPADLEGAIAVHIEAIEAWIASL
jgi:Fe-S-cluster containining protein